MCEEFSKIEKILAIDYSYCKIFILVILNIITAFLVNLFILWYPSLKLWLIYSVSPISKAKFVGVYGADKKFYIVNLLEYNLPDLRNSHLKTYCRSNIQENYIKFFEFKLFKYLYDGQSSSFHSIKFNIRTSQENIHNHFLKGLNPSEVHFQKLIFGDCDLDIKIDSVITLIIKEITDPFYVFQVFSVTLWFCNHYVNYATVIVITTLISLIISVWETRSNLLQIQEMAKYSCPIIIYRQKSSERRISKVSGNEEFYFEKDILTMSSVQLVPGDLFEIPEDGLALPCDCILVNGTVIVNEAMLTGESTPIIKTHIPNTSAIFDAALDKKYILFAGTKVVQKRSHGGGKVLGLALSISFNTEKGNLIRSILYPKEVEFKFKKDSIKYILFMACLSFIGFLISLPFMIRNDVSIYDMINRALDLVTTTVPPSLPACLGIGISYALSRLKKWGIMCINRERVNIAGRVNMICFDKTGTLTEDHLDINGFRPVKLFSSMFLFDNYIDECNDLTENGFTYYKERMMDPNLSEKNKDLKSMFIECLASCHSITKVNGKMVGDPIDIKMFEASGWHLNENLENQENYDSLISTYVRPPQERELKDKLANSELDDEDMVFKTHYELGIVRRFDFSSKLQRMSVLVKNVNEPHFKAFCKGSPEKIKDLCKLDTIPANFNDVLAKYTSKGFRVLAMSMKLFKMDYMQSQKVDRTVIESNMIFLGLLIVQNKLKENTTSSIEVLQDAKLRMVMATGDNILTAISVAKDCMLIKPDASVYTCEISKDNNENILTWNVVENFGEQDDRKSEKLEEHVLGLNFSTMMMNNISAHGNLSYVENKEIDVSGKGFTHHFSPESIGEINPAFESSKVFINENRIENEMKMDLKDDIETDVLNIDVEKHPFKNIDDEYVIAISGSTFEMLWKLRNKYLQSKNERFKTHYETFRLVLQHCYIFARMSPEHKTILVECLREEKFTVCMCGDGANDCGALRAADVGVSLSREEASIAAHFTSNIADISCLIKLLREGKASLVSSIQTFKYMMIYSLIQFMSVTILMVFNSYLTDNQFLTADLFIIFPLAILIARTGAYHKLTPHQPTGALISIPIVSSILIQTVISFIAQYGAWVLLFYQKSWYHNFCESDGDAVKPCYDNTTVFLVSNMQYLTTAIAFSISKPFRKPIYSNYLLCVFIVLALAYAVYIIVDPDVFSARLIGLVTFDDENFKYYILLITFANFIVSYMIEKLVIPCISQKYKHYKYQKLYRQIKQMNITYNLNQLHKIKGK